MISFIKSIWKNAIKPVGETIGIFANYYWLYGLIIAAIVAIFGIKTYSGQATTIVPTVISGLEVEVFLGQTYRQEPIFANIVANIDIIVALEQNSILKVCQIQYFGNPTATLKDNINTIFEVTWQAKRFCKGGIPVDVVEVFMATVSIVQNQPTIIAFEHL